MVPDRLRRAVEKVLPWYDPKAEAAHDARLEVLQVRSEKARRNAEQVRAAYLAYASRLKR